MIKHQEIIDLYKLWDDLWDEEWLRGSEFVLRITEAEYKLDEACWRLTGYSCCAVIGQYIKQGWLG